MTRTPLRHLALLAPALLLVMRLAAAEPPPLLHVPSPDWREQIIYFLMTDRFDDGDPSNNDQGAGEYDPKDSRRYSGGDLAGIIRRLDYIQGLGVTAVWLTPPVANQWWDGQAQYGGYHGYWAEDFKRLDAHVGTLDDYRRLSTTLHGRGMYLVQDVVVNHVGNFFSYQGGWNARDPGRHYQPNHTSVPVRTPGQALFTLNDPRDPEQRAAAVYHWTPAISDFADRDQQLNHQLADLDDLNTENPAVRRALRDSYGHWIREVGVDAFRIDTAFYVPPDFFADFLDADDAQAPGIRRVAAATGRRDFFVFGEGFGIDRPFEDEQTRRIESYVRDADGRALLPGMLNFPLYGAMLDVLARGMPSAVLQHRIDSMLRLHARPHLLPSFIDNHDVERFLAHGSEAALRQALLLMMTLPGIPVIYAGTEQGFTAQRAAMFKTGYGSGGRDHFDAQAPLYRYLQQVIRLRRGQRVLTHGTPRIIAANGAAPGVLVYRMSQGASHILVALNTADYPSLLAADLGVRGGRRLRPLFAIDGAAPELTLGSDARLSLALPPRAGYVWAIEPAPPAEAEAEAEAGEHTELRIDPLATAGVSADLELSGDARGIETFRLVVDGRLDDAVTVRPNADGRWQARIDTASLIDPAIEHEVIAWSDAPRALSEPQRFRVRREWQPRIAVADPSDDDHGRNGKLRYPSGAEWTRYRPLDIRAVRIASSGGSLRIDVQMRELIALWNPPLGFDHLALTVFLQLPERDGGSRVMPLQQGELPGDMRWHYRLRAGGWSLLLTRAEAARPDHEGQPLAGAAQLLVDHARQTISLLIPAAALGHPPSLSGAKLYLNTWDYDAGYRPLQAEAANMRFGGGPDQAKVMDETAVIVLP